MVRSAGYFAFTMQRTGSGVSLLLHRHSTFRWGTYGGHLFQLAGGYAAGTPMTYNDSVVMSNVAKAAAAAGNPYSDHQTLITDSRLPAVTAAMRVQSACSRERPFFLDVGANIGTRPGEGSPSSLTCAYLCRAV